MKIRIFVITVLFAGLLALSWGGPSGCGGAKCGDGVLGGSEVCDGGALSGETCESQGFSTEGTLACASDCSGFDTSGCVEVGTLSALTSVSGDGDDFVTVGSDSAGNRYGAIYSDSATVTAGGLSLPTIAPVVRRGSLARFGDDGNAVWLKSFQGNGTSDDNGVSVIFGASGEIIFTSDYHGTEAVLPDRTITNEDGTGATSDTYVGRLEPDATVDWVATFNSILNDQVFAKFDPSGNLYATGQFAGATVNANGEIITNTGFPGIFDKFLQRIDPATGAPVWTVHFGSDQGADLFPIFDTSGNVFVSGGFNGAILVVDGVNKLTNASPGLPDAFVARLDAATGEPIWITGFSSAGFDFARIQPDSVGNLFVFGGFQGATLTTDGKTLTNADAGATTMDGFVAGLALADGNVDWLKGFASDKPDSVTLAADGTGHMYVSGSFLGATFDAAGQSLTNAEASGTADDFLGLIDPDGTLDWLAHFTGPGFSGGVFGNFTASTDSNHVYVDGTFSGTSLTVSGRTLTNADASGTTADGFIAQFDADGNLGWLLHLSGTGLDAGYLQPDFSTEPSSRFPGDKIFITGNFSSPVLSVGGRTLTNADASGTTSDAFAARVNPADGSFLWLLPISSEGSDGVDLVPDAFGHLSLGGRFQGKTVEVQGTVFTNADASGTTFDGFAGKVAP